MPILALLAIGTDLVLAQQSDTTRNPLGMSAAVIADGRRVYDGACQSCHGPAGRGDRGPALDAGARVHARADGDLFHTIREGVAGTQMPPFRNLSDAEVWQLVSYIRSLAGAGVGGRGGRGAAPPQVVVATTREGREIRGVRLNEDTFSLQLVDASGHLHLLDRLTLTSVRVDAAAPTAVAYGPMSGGVTSDRLVNAGAEPHNWLITGAIIRHALLRAEADRRRERPSAADGLGVSDARRTCSKPRRSSSTA